MLYLVRVCVLRIVTPSHAVYCCEQAADGNNIACYLSIFLEIGSYCVVGNPRFNASESIQLFIVSKEETVYEIFKKIERLMQILQLNKAPLKECSYLLHSSNEVLWRDLRFFQFQYQLGRYFSCFRQAIIFLKMLDFLKHFSIWISNKASTSFAYVLLVSFKEIYLA